MSSGGFPSHAGHFGSNPRDYHQNNSEQLKNIVLVGTKSDLLCEKDREVTFKEAVEFANQMGLSGVIETSSKLESEMQNIQDSFYICACKCVTKAEQQEEGLKASAMKKQESEVVRKTVEASSK